MARIGRAIAAMTLILGVTAAPALAQEDGSERAVIDVTPFLTRGEDFADRNGDGIPDLGELGEGTPGIWDDLVGAATPEEFEERVVPQIPRFDIDDEGSTLLGPCGGLAISYDENGLSIDAMIDRSDDGPPVDVYTGEQAMTEGNPFLVDPGGTVAYWGRTIDLPTFSVAGEIPSIDYGDAAPAFHDHSWAMYVMGISADVGGDPNQRDKNRNAGLIELGEILGDVDAPIDLTELRAKVKARGAIVDLFAEGDIEGRPLPDDVTEDTIESIAAGREYCFGEGWVEFVGDGPPMAATAIASVLAAAGFAGLVFNVRPAQSWRA
jgi:hypothetical protein